MDVRDVALAHVEAMERKEATGKRFLLSSEDLWFKDIGKILESKYKE